MERSIMIVFCLLLSTSFVQGLTTSELSQFSDDVEFVVDGDIYKFFSSGYPSHEIDNSVNPNTAAVQNFNFNITINPNNDVNQVWCTRLGVVGFATDGVAIYNALTDSTTDAVRYEDFDNCQGHSSPDGTYHYHQFPSCVAAITEVDKFMGIALDGNPIYGPKASDFDVDITSADLDACHGRFKDGRYRYHITEDFPYSIGCYKAEPANKGRGACTNTEYGAMLCDCTSGTLTQCDTLTEDDAHLCDDTSSTVTTSTAPTTTTRRTTTRRRTTIPHRANRGRNKVVSTSLLLKSL